ncbi:MAG: hypothetical protein M1579_05550, partial [Gammaproteobacteria bacterium]|nr:hypothetical protein [Gammaproteobacteria bacterium]
YNDLLGPSLQSVTSKLLLKSFTKNFPSLPDMMYLLSVMNVVDTHDLELLLYLNPEDCSAIQSHLSSA